MNTIAQIEERIIDVLVKKIEIYCPTFQVTYPSSDEFTNMQSLFDIPRVVDSGKPIRLRHVVQHRTDILIQEQISVVIASQDVFRQSVLQLEIMPEGNDRLVERMRELIENQRLKLNEMILIAQIASKIKRELVHARNELKKALKTSTNIYGARKRLVWLEGQLEYLLTEKCPKTLEPVDVDNILTPTPSPTPEPTPKEATPEPCQTPESDDRSENEKVADDMRNALSRMESNSMTKDEIQDTWNKYKERREVPRVEVDYDALLEDLMDEEMDDDGDDDDDNDEALERLASLGIDLAELSKPASRLRDFEAEEEEQEVTQAVSQEPETDFEELAASETSDRMDDFTDVSETSENEKKFAEGRSEELEENEHSGIEFEITETELELERLKTPESLRDGASDELETRELSPDLSRDYWLSEHHRFHFSEHAQALIELDPLSYHQVGLAVPGTFIKTVPRSTSTLPWRHKQAGEIHDVHRVALDKLSLRVQKMYDNFYHAAMLSVDPDHNQVQDRGHFLQNVDKQTVDERSTSHTISREHGRDSSILPPIIKSRSGPLVALKFHSKPIPKAKRLPVSKMNLRQTYPRTAAEITAINDRPRREKVLRIVNQLDLYEETKLTSSLFKSKVRRTSSALELAIQSLPGTEGRDESRLRKVLSVARAASRFGSALMHGRPPADPTGLKWKRVQELVSVNMKSSRTNDRVEAAKQLGLLGCTEVTVLTTLEESVLHDVDAEVRFECAKTLIILGVMREQVLALLIEHLVCGSTAIRVEVLRAIITGRNAHLMDKSTANFKRLVKVLNKLVDDPNPGSHVAFDASICLGKICVPSEKAANHLKKTVQNGTSSEQKYEALSTLVRQMNCHDQLVLDAIFHQMKFSYMWRHRADAAKLLMILGPEVLCKESKVKSVTAQFLTVPSGFPELPKTKHTNQRDYVYGLIEERLWDERSYEVRKVMAMVAHSLGIVARACERAEKKLEDVNKKVRAQGVITVGTLGLKKKSVIKTLLEMVDLDASEYVRLQIIKTFGVLGLRETKVLRCLRERVKAGGPLGREAAKVLSLFGESLEM